MPQGLVVKRVGIVVPGWGSQHFCIREGVIDKAAFCWTTVTPACKQADSKEIVATKSSFSASARLEERLTEPDWTLPDKVYKLESM